jgi:hypothetical protein
VRSLDNLGSLATEAPRSTSDIPAATVGNTPERITPAHSRPRFRSKPKSLSTDAPS